MRYRSFKAHLKELGLVHATDGKQFHSLTVDIKYEEVKLLSVSFDLLVPTHMYHVNGSLVGTYLYYDTTIEYFGDKHLPYAVLALFTMPVFILFPILLLVLYPMRFFQQCLGCCRASRHALHIFIASTLQLHFSVHFSVPSFAFHHVCSQSYSIVL